MQIKESISKIKNKIYTYINQASEKYRLRNLQIVLIILTVLFASFSLVYPSLSHSQIQLDANGKWAVNKNAPEDVFAITDFNFLMKDQYKRAQDEAARQTPIHLNRDFSFLEKNISDKENESKSFQEILVQDIESLASCRKVNKKQTEILKCMNHTSKLWRVLNAEDWQSILRFSSKSIQQKIEQLVFTIFDNYAILKTKDNDPLFYNFSGASVHINNIQEGVGGNIDIPWENVIIRNQLYNDFSVKLKIKELAKTILPKLSQTQRQALLKLTRGYLYPLDAYRFDKTKTLEAQERQRSQIPVADYVFHVKRGENIVHRNDIINESVYQALKAHQSGQWYEIIYRFISAIVQQLIFLGFILYYILRFADKRINRLNINLALFATIWIFTILLLFIGNLWETDIKTNEFSHFFGAWVPAALFSVVLAILFGEKLSLPWVLYMSFLVYIASNYDEVSFFITVTMSLMGLILGIKIKKRIHFISVTLALILISFVIITLAYLYTNRNIFESYDNSAIFTENYRNAVIATFFWALCTLLAIGILPLYEAIFNIASHFKLIELADTSHPLLRQLFQRAPSTWMHTMMVATLTEKACESLGLNATLACTGIYFHDIGKMQNAGFFIENQHLIPKPENVDKKNPSIAAKVIINHVTDGIKMAKLARLPQEVIDFIPEHHGTSTMSFFYHKALQKNRRRVNKEDFQYKGPKPQSKETAIAMIADSVEAAYRSLESHKRETVSKLIQSIIDAKMLENQFDESEITVRDLGVIKKSFLDVLLSSAHSRPKYPDKTETSKLEKKQIKENSKNSSAKKTNKRSVKKKANRTIGK